MTTEAVENVHAECYSDATPWCRVDAESTACPARRPLLRNEYPRRTRHLRSLRIAELRSNPPERVHVALRPRRCALCGGAVLLDLDDSVLDNDLTLHRCP